MPKYTSFEDLPVWQEAARLYNRVLDLLELKPRLLASGFLLSLIPDHPLYDTPEAA